MGDFPLCRIVHLTGFFDLLGIHLLGIHLTHVTLPPAVWWGGPPGPRGTPSSRFRKRRQQSRAPAPPDPPAARTLAKRLTSQQRAQAPRVPQNFTRIQGSSREKPPGKSLCPFSRRV